jgi:ATP-dependent protease ClpP protease subunit
MLSVGHDIGGGDVRIGTDVLDELAYITAAQTLLLAFGQAAGIAYDAALAAAERNIHDGTFHVIHIESARMVSTVSWGWNLMPPFAGPLASLCCIR